VQADVPIWLGGRSPRSLRRALALADGWDPFRLSLPELEALLARARDSAAWRARFEVVLTPEGLPDPAAADAADRLTDVIARYQAAGATAINLRFRHRSLAHCLEQLDAFATTVAPRFAAC
jgi:alkanesulfonate monooxygenase SsuD/methylene tetrahydromethanopterin reductase-like flavin-dependent oxidoreductase (luciferase family)